MLTCVFFYSQEYLCVFLQCFQYSLKILKTLIFLYSFLQYLTISSAILWIILPFSRDQCKTEYKKQQKYNCSHSELNFHFVLNLEAVWKKNLVQEMEAWCCGLMWACAALGRNTDFSHQMESSYFNESFWIWMHLTSCSYKVSPLPRLLMPVPTPAVYWP